MTQHIDKIIIILLVLGVICISIMFMNKKNTENFSKLPVNISTHRETFNNDAYATLGKVTNDDNIPSSTEKDLDFPTQTTPSIIGTGKSNTLCSGGSHGMKLPTFEYNVCPQSHYACMAGKKFEHSWTYDAKEIK